MKKKTIASIATGGGLVEMGARDAGFEPIWGIEIVDEIAQVARDNGLHVITGDITKVNPNDFERPFAFHASLPCISFSNASADGEENDLDIAMARATAWFIEVLEPKLVTLENVSMWRFSASWALIQDALDRLGYWMSVQNHLNMADWGVPQTRKRMIVRAIRGGWLPPLPAPVPWRGWYQAVGDLIPGLPNSKFADWQLARMPEELLNQTLLFSQGISQDHKGNEYPVKGLSITDPAFTVTANRNMKGVRAFIMPGGGNTNFNEAHSGKGCRYEKEPAHTVVCQDGGGTYPKAFIVDGANAHGDDRLITTRKDGEPMFTVSAQSLTKNPIRAAVPGRVVQMRPRCLARFQSIRDDYALPDNATLATRIIGNAVPPLFYQQLVEPWA